MRTIGHWTPRYVYNRARLWLDHRRHPDDPWLTREAIEILTATLTDAMTAVETGSGRSTLWFARHVGRLVSVEHDPAWYARISERLHAANVANVLYLLREVDPPGVEAARSAYVRVFEGFAPESIDFVLVDGAYREGCATAALRCLRAGGLLVVDNANWFLPSETISPASRSPRQGPLTPGWAAFDEATRDWRRIWTSNGVTDTAFFFRPGAARHA